MSFGPQLFNITFGGCPSCGRRDCVARSCTSPYHLTPGASQNNDFTAHLRPRPVGQEEPLVGAPVKRKIIGRPKEAKKGTRK